MNTVVFKKDISDEVATILASEFTISVTNTQTVPHATDPVITFPNLDTKAQSSKLIKTTVLYIDMRRSTQLSLKHKTHTVAKLYSAFVRAMTRCATLFGGHVRGIIGDRVMVLFPCDRCFERAVDTAALMNSVCQYVIDKHFAHGDVTFGIGIDYGRMLATKTGIRKRGADQHNYRSLVWLGRPANVASKLTDNANKAEESADVTRVRAVYDYGHGAVFRDEYPWDFVQNFNYDPNRHAMIHTDPGFQRFITVSTKYVSRVATKPILISKRVYDGLKAEVPNERVVRENWFTPVAIAIPEHPDTIYEGDVIWDLYRPLSA